MKKLYALLWIVLPILLFFALEVEADTYSSVDDQAGLFTSEESNQLETILTSIEIKTHARVFIVTTDDTTIDSTEFADCYMLNKIGKNQNGITFFIDMGQRNFIISTSGNMSAYLTDRRIDTLLDTIEPSMIAGDYVQASTSFLEKTTQFIDEGIPNKQARVDKDTGEVTYVKSLTALEIFLAFIVSLAVGIGFYCYILFKYRLKIGTYSYPFEKQSKVELQTRQDTLVNSFITTRRIPKHTNNGGPGGSSTHTTGGGTFGGGRSG